MKQNETIQSNVEAALGSLDGLQRAEANPYLHTRVLARLHNRRKPATAWDTAARWVAKPVFAAAIMVMVIAVNYAILSKSKERQLHASQDIENVLSAEYATTNMYSLESVADR